MAQKIPFWKVFPGDEKTSGIYECSLRAEGLWKRLRDLMSVSEKRGYLIKDGQAMRVDVAAKWCCITPQEYQDILIELSSAGLMKLTKQGLMYDPTLVHQEELRIRGQIDAFKRWGRRHRKGKSMGTPLGTPMASLNMNMDVVVKAFEGVWGRYPRRLGQKDALRHFKASVLSTADVLAIDRALNNYLAHILREKIEPKFIQHGSTWFNNWRDWIDYKPPGEAMKPKEKTQAEFRVEWVAKGLSPCCGGKMIDVDGDEKLWCEKCRKVFQPSKAVNSA